MMLLSLVAACGGGGSTGTPEDMTTAVADLTTPTNQDGGAPADMIPCSTPPTLHPPVAGKPSIFCPFAAASGMPAVYCMQGMQHCCEPSAGTSMCDATAMACPTGNTDWQCQDPTDCGTGMQCCGTGTLVVNGNPMCANFGSKFTGTHCAATCMATEVTMCTSDGECTGGKHCLPFKTKGAGVGGCN